MEQEFIQKLIDTKEEYSKKVIAAYLTEDSIDNNIDIIDNDEELKASDIESMKKHNQDFNALLSAYVKNADKNLRNKLELKITFFYVCIIIMILVTFVTILISCIALFNDFKTEHIISVLLTNAVSFFTSFIILPKTIATYLFNTDEEKNMTEIIKSIQDYDKDIRNRLKKN